MTTIPRVRRSIRRLAYWVFPVLALIAAWQIWDTSEARWLEEELARVFPEGVEPKPRWSPDSPPPTNDAAPYYTAANLAGISSARVDSLRRAAEPVRLLGVLTRIREEMWAGGAPAPADVAELERWFDVYELPLMLMAEARGRPYLQVSEANVEAALRMYGLVPAIEVAGGQTLTLVQGGDAEAAAESLIVRLKAMRAHDGQGTWFAASMKMRDIDDITTDVGLLLSRTSPSDEALTQLDQALAEVYAEDEHARLIEGEIRNVYFSMRRIWRGRDPAGRSTSPLNRPALRRLTRHAVRTGAEVRAAARLPWPERIRALDGIEDRPSVMRWFVGARTQTGWPIAEMSRNISRSYGGLVAALRCARVAIAIERHRMTRGSVPDSLDELDLAAPERRDPFTGQSLTYVRDDDGYTIYSAGEDFRDGGGSLRGTKPFETPARRFATDRGIRVRRR